MPTDSTVIIIYVVCIIAFFYLFLIRPQKKRDKQANVMLGGMEVDDKVVTIGGVVGTVVNMKDDEVVVETSIDKTKITFKKVAVKEVIKPEKEENK
jgi:preprotein translocase subunit YajC